MSIVRAIKALAVVAILFATLAPARAYFDIQSSWAGGAGGSANAITLTLANVTSLNDLLGVPISFIPASNNTGATTIAVSGLAATAVKRSVGSGLVALSGGDFIAGSLTYVVYDGTEFVLYTPTSNWQSPTITGTVAGGATYTAPTITSPSITGAVSGGASYSSVTLTSPTVTGAFTATGLVTNSDLVNSSTTVNGQTCTLGSTCTITASAGTITVGTTTVASSTNGHVLYNNGGTLGDIATTGSGSVVLGTSPSIASAALSGTITGNPTLSGNLTLSGTDNFTGTFEVAGYAMTFPGAAATLAALTLADQTLAGGANVTSLSDSTGGITVDCGARPLQYITNGGNFTITAPTHDGSCMLLITNNGSAGTISFNGFTTNSNTGEPFDTTSGHKFTVTIWEINGTASYVTKALQ